MEKPKSALARRHLVLATQTRLVAWRSPLLGVVRGAIFDRPDTEVAIADAKFVSAWARDLMRQMQGGA
ncbi:MAG: hypothetical protein PVTTEEND_001297 [Candidatus Fervidibacter sp.]|jgi:hypothetical protein